MEIAPNTTSLSPSANRSGAAAPQEPAAITSDFDTFLRMLTAQISNQDPLNPINSEQFAVQLATFSGVEQQVRTNQLLESLMSLQGRSDFGQMASWVGMQARAAMPTLYEGQPLTVTPTPPVAGSRHDLVALNEVGEEIWRGRYFSGSGSVVWDGVRADGVAAPNGLYGFRIESFDGDQLVATAPVMTYGAVQEVRMEQGGAVLVFEGGVERFVDEVSALRRGAVS